LAGFVASLAVFPSTVDVAAAAAVSDTSADDAADLLARLAESGITHLVACKPVGLYVLTSRRAGSPGLSPLQIGDLRAARARHAQHFLLDRARLLPASRTGVDGDLAEYDAYVRLNTELASRHVRNLLQARAKPRARSHPMLTDRQWQVAHLIALGRTNDQIASALGIAKWTAINHVRSVMRRLECASRVDVTRLIVSSHDDNESPETAAS
jgi:DNA-binding CsgD family transcriptional regulator